MLSEHLRTLTPTDRELNETQHNYKQIVILSEDLASLTLLLGTGRNNRLWFAPAQRHDRALIIQVIQTLRHSDSTTFWGKTEALGATLLLKDVRWSTGLEGEETISLPIYLDYSLAVQHRELAKIVRRALRRVLAAFPEHNALPIDDLIRPDLADASRWMEKAPTSIDTPKCFVISSVVTGATVKREARHRGDPAAVLACFIAGTNPPQALDEQRFRYFSALRWAPRTTEMPSHQHHHWERVPGTPYVRPFVLNVNDQGAKISLIRPISRIVADRGTHEHCLPSVAESYHEWHRDQLLKVGHWNIERRHDLLEINHLGALQISAVSGRGFYEWLVHELTVRSSGIAYPLLVYPPGRLNAVMVRHLFKLRDSKGIRRLHENWRAVPISYLPDIGDGLKQLTQLAEDHIRRTTGAVGGKVFFVDIGYVGNRTFRHTKRQLLALGVKQLVGLGLLNRTSAPALTEPLDDHEVVCYWRLDVPSLDDQRSCPVCSGLRAMDVLLERTRRFQPAITKSVSRINSYWALADPGQQWEEHGLVPLNLPAPIKKKFGFIRPPVPQIQSVKKTGQQSLISQGGEPIPPPSAPQTWWKRDDNLGWNHVWLRDSAQATAYAIEIARILSSPTYPLRLAHKLAGYKEPNGSIFKGVSTAMEVLGSYLLLSAHELSSAVKEAAGVQILRYLAKLESATADFIEEVSADRLVRLRGLASLALINLDGSTKRLLLDEILKLVTTTRFINDETRIALMAVLLDSTDEKLPVSAGTPTFDQRVRHLLQSDHVVNSDVANVVRSNYWSLTLSEHSLAEQFDHALRFFGAGEAHGDCMDRLKDAESWVTRQPGPSWASCRTTLQNAYSMICCGDEPAATDQSSSHVLGDLFRALCSFRVSDLQLLCAKSAQETVVSHSSEVKEAIDLVTRVRKSFQESMIRFETNHHDEGFSVLMTTIQKCVEGTAGPQASSVRVVLANRGYSQAVGARYLLFGIELSVLLDRLIKDALRNAPASSGNAPSEIAEYWVIGDIRALVLVVGDSTGEICLRIWNCGSDASDAEEFVRQQMHLAIIHRELGTRVERYAREFQNQTWFCTEIAFKWVPGGKS